MRKFVIRLGLWMVLPLALGWTSLAAGQAGATNYPPQVSMVWPRQGVWWDNSFSVSTLIKIKAEANDPDGTVAQVQFLVGTNLIGVATNPPFNLIWVVGEGVPFQTFGGLALKAVAIDDSGAKAESPAVTIQFFTGIPPIPVLEINSPPDGAVFAAPATFAFSAEVLAVPSGDAGPVEFFLGPNSLGIVDQGTAFTPATPPSSVTVSNVPEGEHKLTVRFRGGDDGRLCPCNWITNTVRVVNLGLQLPSLTTDGLLRFEGVTAFPGKPTVIQTSTDLAEWVPVSTNFPSSNTFTFTELSPATNGQRFYRAFIAPE